jgi:anti-anti-sigma factor
MADLATEDVNGWLIVRFTTPSLTEPMMLERLKHDLDSRLSALPTGARVVVSFKGVEFVSSQIIGMMLAAKEQVRRKKGQFALARLGQNIMDILRLTKLDSQFKIGQTETDIVGRRPKPLKSDDEGRGDGGPSEPDWMD